jgi:hypothetical protein
MVLAIGSRFVYTPDVEQINSFIERVEESTPAAPAPIQQTTPAPPTQELNPENMDVEILDENGNPIEQ